MAGNIRNQEPELSEFIPESAMPCAVCGLFPILAYKQRDAGLADIKTDPLFKNLRHDPRFTEFLKKMRLPT